MLRRLCYTALGLAALTVVTALYADEPRQTKGTKTEKTDELKDLKELAGKEKILQERYAKFEADLQALHDRWAKGTDAERQNAARLKLALDRSVDTTITERFSKFVRFLAAQKLTDNQVASLVTQSEAIGRDLKEVLDLLKGMNNPVNRKEERLSLEDQIKKLDQLIKQQNIINGKIEIGLDKDSIKEHQTDVTEATKNLSKQLAKDKKDKDKGDKNGQGNEAKNDKSEAKEGKGDGDKAQSKDAGKESKNNEAKPGDAKNAGEKKSGDKQGQAKEGGKESKAGQESKPGDSKPGDSKGGESKAGDKKDGKGSEGKAGDKKDSQGDKGKEGAAKDGGDKKEGEKQGSLKTKQDEKKAGDESKAGDKKEGAAKSGQGDKQGQPKNAEGKAGEKSESKSGSESGKSSQGESKSGKSGDGQGQPKSGGQPQDDPGSSKKDSPKNDDNPQAKQGPKQNVDNAVQKQEDLVKNIDKNKNKAVDDGKTAAEQLEQAKRKLEELLRQLREEEQAQLLATLIQRCKEMLRMQEEVLKGTEAVARAIDANNTKKPNNVNTQDALNLSDDEKKIVLAATKAIELLESEGSAVAFPEVFQQVREDMKHVARRLAASPVDPGKVTQAIEQDIVDTLKEMVKALEDAKKKLEDKKSPPPPPPGGSPPPQPDPKLLNKIQELKMVRAMQLRVNARTTLYGKEYPGEQADDPVIRRELRNLSDRQERIFDVTRNIAKGENP